jgi:hypothetical protein
MEKIMREITTKIINGVELALPTPHQPDRALIGDAPEELSVVCVWWGELYGPEYVRHLRDSVARNLTVPYTFYCITDRLEAPEGMVHIPCENQTGWWQKVNLFKPGLFKGRVLYLDLDVVIINTLDPLVSSEGDFVIIENFGPNKGQSAFNSSAMLWTPNEKTERIYTCFTDEVMQILHGDQCWIWRVLGNDVLAFEKPLVESYKYSALPQWRRFTANTSVMVFHGSPKPHQVSEKLIVSNWR